MPLIFALAMSVTLPYDVLEQVVAYIDDYPDVLNFALSNKEAYSLAVPQHLHYRDIRCKLRNPSLWQWLSRSENRRVAHIRSLTILPEDAKSHWLPSEHLYDLRRRLPAELSTHESPSMDLPSEEVLLDSERKLISALKRMSNLQRFRWYHLPGPQLNGGNNVWSTLKQLGSVKEVDAVDLGFYFPGVTLMALSKTFLSLTGFTSFKHRTAIGDSLSDDKYPEIPLLEHMLVYNLPELRVLALELDHNEQRKGTADIGFIMTNGRWLFLRVLRLQGVNCRAPELMEFLIFHSTLEELALAEMMPGHAWTQIDLPRDALPNLRHLECSSAQAVALLKNRPNSSLKTLHGVEVHDTIVNSDYFTWDEDWADWRDCELDDDGAYEKQPSPWKEQFLECLKAQTSLTNLRVASIDVSQEMETLSIVAPQLKELDIGDRISDAISANEWHSLYSLFPLLEVIWAGHLLSLDSVVKPSPEAAVWADREIQALAWSCPRLRVILIGVWAKKAVIIRGAESSVGVSWVVRRWEESEDGQAKIGEQVFGPEYFVSQ
ncbi:hypothetical protein GALMADRAFT_247003 [Galerina marginata CBS 339.88]|uniref:F-box domain-containing protein n=1 Tax=Galerina marginata (strain CBS 339.88) TaxID=685588 RepID=A0A067T0D4_GALM3|nr:hypothetical protein GALMADRAFT_247003 [Galerina marginata CBS 339.88]